MLKTKDKVLSILKEIQGDFISGQDIAEKIFVTRAAVWKAIKALKDEGYDIDAVTNRGYRLRYVPDLIDERKIQDILQNCGIDLKVFHYDQVLSTNDTALKIVKENNSSALVIAETQTNGRGRRGREFYSPESTGLYMSISFCTDKSILYYRNITAMAASATALAIDDVVFDGADTTKIKWVNDIFIDQSKVAGILTECYGALEDEYNYIVIGIGINVYAPKKDFPKELKNIAGAVFSRGKSKDGDIRNQIGISIVKYLCSFLKNEKSLNMKCLDTYKKKSFLIGNYVKINSFNGNHTYAYVDGISDEYELLVTYDDGSKGIFNSGEVSVVKY